MYKHGDVRGKVSREFDDVTGESMSQLCTYSDVYGAVLYIPERSRGTIRDWRTCGSTTRACYDYTIKLSYYDSKGHRQKYDRQQG